MISAVVPTRGGDAFGRVLGPLLTSLDASGEDWELVVVDRSGGRTIELDGPVAVVPVDEDRGYGAAVNQGVWRARGEYVLVASDEVRLEAACVRVLRGQLPAAGLFAVVPRIASGLAACGDEGGRSARFGAGLLELAEAPSDTAQPTLYPAAACFLCPRPAFLAIGGFDEAYLAGPWQDVDLGYRAWRRGHRVLHVPEAECRREAEPEPAADALCNRALFHLRNLQDAGLRERAVGALTALALFGTPGERASVAQALSRHDGAAPAEDGLSDVEILERAGVTHSVALA